VEHESLVSIIIPVYNAEKYLSNSIESILNQTHKKIELILVNDGSTDNSSLICDEYAEIDHRVKVIYQKNGGPSSARNNGIKIATGKYIQFVDSDDTIEPTMTHRLVESMNNDVQLALCGYKSFETINGKTIIRKSIPFLKGTYKNKDFIKCFVELFKGNLINSLCNKLYVNKIIIKSNLHFNEEVHMGEDLLFNLEYFKLCSNFSIIDIPLYNYIVSNNNNSLTESFKNDFFNNQQMLFIKVRNFLIENNSYKDNHKLYIEESYTNSIINCLSNLFHEKSHLTTMIRKKEIYRIVSDVIVIENINYFSEGNIQKLLIGYMIKIKSVNSIYWFLIIKTILQTKLGPFYNFAKLLNTKFSSKNNVIAAIIARSKWNRRSL